MEFGTVLAQFAQVAGGEAAEQRFAARGQFEVDAATIDARGKAAHELAADEAINETHDAMMAKLQPLGQFADGGRVTAGKALDGEQRLMLLRRETGGARRFLAEMEEARQGVAEGGEHFVV